MRSLVEMELADAKATVRDAQDMRGCGQRLTQEQAHLVFEAIRVIQRIEGTGDEKQARAERWQRRKAQSRARFWDRFRHA